VWLALGVDGIRQLSPLPTCPGPAAFKVRLDGMWAVYMSELMPCCWAEDSGSACDGLSTHGLAVDPRGPLVVEVQLLADVRCCKWRRRRATSHTIVLCTYAGD
jgi:hypothetical protein